VIKVIARTRWATVEQLIRLLERQIDKNDLLTFRVRQGERWFRVDVSRNVRLLANAARLVACRWSRRAFHRFNDKVLPRDFVELSKKVKEIFIFIRISRRERSALCEIFYESLLWYVLCHLDFSPRWASKHAVNGEVGYSANLATRVT